MPSAIKALVHTLRYEAPHVLGIELRPASPGARFPSFTAGAHIDLHLPNRLVRSYSLCNSQDETHRYVLGVLNAPHGRGGARYLHDRLRVGAVIDISAPRNNFALDEGAEASILVAGGIGVTPIRAMLRRLRDLGRPVHLLYSVRSRREAAYVEEFENLDGSAGAVHLHFDDEQGGPPVLESLLAPYGSNAHYYCCGPALMLDAFRRACRSLGFEHVHVERFSSPPGAHATGADAGYEVELARSRRVVQVPQGKSLLDTLLRAGVDVPFSCREGTCGACETPVLSGAVEHRDSLLSEQEKAGNNTMMVCVSVCTGARLVLDI